MCPLFLWSFGRQEFVDAYVNYIFQTSVHEWYTAFSDGFLKVCGGKVLELFQPSELRAMMVGNSDYDWGKLEEVSLGGAVFGLLRKHGDLAGRAWSPVSSLHAMVHGIAGLLHPSAMSYLLSDANGMQMAATMFFYKVHFFLF